MVAKAAPDGYTLMLTASIHIITPFLNSKIPYDAVKDFAPVSLVAAGPLLVSTAPNVPANSLKEFFDLVRKEPDEIHLRDLELRLGRTSGGRAAQARRRVDTLVIAYKGAGPMLNDIMGGQIQLIADPMASSLPLAASGKIKALAVTSLKRVAAAPDIPTIAESGMTGFEFSSWYGLWGPKGLPADITAKLQTEVVKALAQPDMKERLAVLGFEPIGSTPAEFAKYHRRRSRRSTSRSSRTRRSRRSELSFRGAAKAAPESISTRTFNVSAESITDSARGNGFRGGACAPPRN